jgi:hypothetical protein
MHNRNARLSPAPSTGLHALLPMLALLCACGQASIAVAPDGALDDAASSSEPAQAADAGSRFEEAALDGARRDDVRMDAEARSWTRGEAGAPIRPTSADAASDSGAQPDSAAPIGEGSCYGRCGAAALLAKPGPCGCDVGCYERRDCCRDKHELCAASEAAPVCPLTGTGADPATCGSDLGWSFTHQGAIEILFGDSYDADCRVPFLYDDAQGRLELARPASVPERPPAQPISCGRVVALDKVAAAPAETFAPMRLFEAGVALSSWLLETPLTGFSDGTRVHTIFRRGNQLGSPLYVATRDARAAPNVSAGRAVYRVLQQYATRHFQNLTAVGVTNLSDEQPAQNDYREGVHTLLLFGRDAFSGPSARALYLARQALPVEAADGASRWAPLYFAGLQGGRPRWSPSEQSAVAILNDEFETVLQPEVAWIGELERWIMLYGGDVADAIDAAPNGQPRHGAIHMRMAEQPWGPWTRATPVFFREHAAAFLHCDAPRMAPPGQPSGCDLDDLPDDPGRSYSPGSWGSEWRDFAGCRTDAPLPRTPSLTPGSILPCNGAQRGNLYAPNLLAPWTVDRRSERGYAHAATLYFNVSTWYPYQVVLAALSLHLP